MAKILFNVTHGPENPTRAALAFHVAKAALEEGHAVTLLAGKPAEFAMPKTLVKLTLEHDRVLSY